MPECGRLRLPGRTATYADLLASVDRCANALAAHRARPGRTDHDLDADLPAGRIPFYAAEKLGAVASMIHPLSTPGEIAGYLNLSGSRIAVTLDAFYGSSPRSRSRQPLETLVLARISDDLPPSSGWDSGLTKGRKIPRCRPTRASGGGQSSWPASIRRRLGRRRTRGACGDPLSGGTTGRQRASCSRTELRQRGDAGRGRGSAWDRTRRFSRRCRSSTDSARGARQRGSPERLHLVLVPLHPEIVAKLIRKSRPTLIAGVPTLYEALAETLARRADLSSLRAAFSGADTLPRTVRRAVRERVAARGGKVRLSRDTG